RIARHVEPDPVGAVDLVDSLFGSARRTTGAGRGSHEDLRPSPLRMADTAVCGAKRLHAARIRVDRLTRSVVAGALFAEEPVVDGTADIRLVLRQEDVSD